MPTSSTRTTRTAGSNGSSRTVVVCFPAGADGDWFCASEVIDHHLDTAGSPVCRFPVRHRWLIGLVTRWLAYTLVDPVRRFGAVARAAGGRKRRLDLISLVRVVNADAVCRWWAWHRYVAAHTPAARPWADFKAHHDADPSKVSFDESRRRFEQQPRVVAMIATSLHPVAPFVFDPYEVDAYQAGEATYAALHWKTALAGDCLVTAEGVLLQPASPSLADRLRYLDQAVGYISGMNGGQHVCAVAVDYQR